MTNASRLFDPDGFGLRLAILGLVVIPASSGVAEEAADIEAICAGERLVFAAPPFDAFDADGNRLISDSEASACPILEEVFGRLDLDADQALTAVEYAAFADVWRRREQVFEGEQE